MSSKSTLTVSVEANTSKASGQLKQFKSTVDSLNKGSGGGFMDQFNTGKIDLGGLKNSFGEITTNLQNLRNSFSNGLDLKSIGQAGTSIKSLGSTLMSATSKTGLLTKGLSALGGPAGVAITAAAAMGGLAKAANEWIEKGKDSYNATNKLGQSLKILDKNMGGSGRNFDDFIKSLRRISNDGVSSFDTIESGAKQLLIALNGNENKALDLIKTFDTLAAGTGIQVDDWASMASEVFNTGVSIKDLTRLSNKGIPIYQALGKAMGVTAEEAEQMAKKGMVSTKNWTDAIHNLADVFKGLSQQMSQMNVDQVESKIEQSRNRLESNASATKGYESAVLPERKERLQEVRQQEDLLTPLFSNVKQGIGEITGHFSNFFNKVGDYIDDLGLAMKTTFFGVIDYIGGFSEKYEKQAGSNQLKFVTDQLSEFRKGNLNEEQIKNLATIIQSDKYGKFSEEDGSLKQVYFDALKELNNKIKEFNVEEKERMNYADEDAAGQRALKYGSLDQKIEYLSRLLARAGIGEINNASELPGIYEKLKQGFVNGEMTGAMGAPVDMDKVKNLLEVMSPVVNDVISANNKTAQSEEELRQAREKSAQAAEEAAQKIKQDEIRDYIQGKAEIGRNITSAQENYNSVTDRLERLRAERQVIAQEEANGIFRKKWGNLDVSELSTQESELVKQQEEAGKKLDALKDKYEKFDENWQKSAKLRDEVMNNIKSKLPITVKNLASLAG